MANWRVAATGWALVAALAACAGCTRPQARAPAGPLVLVVVDTVRADHLTCYGYERATSPSMCALATDGTRFARAYTTRTATTPAIASMLTGLYPHRHGVRDLYLLLPEPLTTVAERLHDAGWATGAFVSSFVMVNDFSGFAQGFDVYDDDVRTRELLRDNFEREAATTVARAVDWLERHGPRAFLFVHLIEPHGPYTPPSPYRERLALPAVGEEPGFVPDYQRVPGLRTVSEFVGRYDGEIATADAAIGTLLDALRARGWYEPATIIVTADHGESLGEEGRWFQHGLTVHDAEAHVPLIVKLAGDPDGLAPGHTVRTPVSVVDVYPTLLHAAGLEAGESAVAVDLAAIARGAARAEPPLTELEDKDRVVTIAVHGDACTVRLAMLPETQVGEGASPAAWIDAARVVRVDPSDNDAECARMSARRAAALVADRFEFRLDVPVAQRVDMRDVANRPAFIAARTRQARPLAAHELEALRQLGYAE